MALFEPIEIRSLRFRNRIVVSPMCQYSSEDGFANDWHLVHLGGRAVGGASAVIAEATAVTADGRISPQDLGIWKDEHIDFLSRVTAFTKSQGSIPGIQLAHAGRKASNQRPWEGGKPATLEDGGWSPIWAPSAIPFHDGWQTPEALTEAGIGKIVGAFRDAATRALAAGFQLIEIHGAHGYLLHEFLSPISNRREDRYGGSFENRCRIVLEVIDAVREVWPDSLPLFLRLSGTDWTEGGWTIDETVTLAKNAHARGIDLIDCSSGGNVPNARIPVQPGYQVPIAEAVKRAGVPAGAVGMITDPVQADEIISAGKADLIVLARALLRDPYWPLHAAKALGKTIDWPKQYERARD